MSSLGQMVAGVAHEINNPANFIHGNLTYVDNYMQDLLQLLQAYQKNYPKPPENIQALLDETDINFLREDLTKIIHSMQFGTQRIREIVLSLRNFSRLDETGLKKVNIHEGIDNSLMLLQHRIHSQVNRPEIQIIKKYNKLPLIECYPAQLNQVFINIITNAIETLEESLLNNNRTDNNSPIFNPTICIHTQMTAENKVLISITDNGVGIPEKIHSKLFDPFFTTKPVGKGTGLGLYISYQIVVEKHRGKIWYDSTLAQGAKFVIEIPVKS
jgi:signal transduction histidine kinase